MTAITFEGQEYEPFALVLHLLSQFPDPGCKVDPRIKPLLDKKQELLAAVQSSLVEFKAAVKLAVDPKSQELLFNESSNLFAHLLCAQRGKLGGLKPFGYTKSSVFLQAIMKQNGLPPVIEVMVEGDKRPVFESESESEFENEGEAAKVSQGDEGSINNLLAKLKNNDQEQSPTLLRSLTRVLRKMPGGLIRKEEAVRGLLLEGAVSEKSYEQGSLLDYLMTNLSSLEAKYGLDEVMLLLCQLPQTVLLDIKEHYASEGSNPNPLSIVNMVGSIQSVNYFIQNPANLPSVIDKIKNEQDPVKRLLQFNRVLKYYSKSADLFLARFQCANDIFLQKKIEADYAVMLNSADSLINLVKDRDESKFSPELKNGLNHVRLSITESRKAAMHWFAGIQPDYSKYNQARDIIKSKFGHQVMNAPLFCREIKILLQQNRRVEAIRLCAAADRRSFVNALLLSDEGVVALLAAANNSHLSLFTHKIQKALKLTQRLSENTALAARPITVKISNLFGLFSVAEDVGGCPDARHRDRERSSPEAPDVFFNKN